jgi:hypothetical protein
LEVKTAKEMSLDDKDYGNIRVEENMSDGKNNDDDYADSVEHCLASSLHEKNNQSNSVGERPLVEKRWSLSFGKEFVTSNHIVWKDRDRRLIFKIELP